MNRKISLICTVLNEEDNIEKFIDSILKQTLLPDEFIIIDGGSKDNTVKIIKRKFGKKKRFKVLVKRGANISEGRNIAIRNSKHEIIVGADAGTTYNRDWLEKLTKDFKGGVGFGKTIPLAHSRFQKVLARKIRQRFGSSRNIIFEKRIWKEVGGYPEDLDIAEDTLFNQKIKMLGIEPKKIPKAISRWEMRKDYESLRKQFYRYGFWDGVAYKKYKILPLKRRISISVITILFPAYFLLNKISRFSPSIKIEVTMRSSYISGFWEGFIKKK